MPEDPKTFWRPEMGMWHSHTASGTVLAYHFDGTTFTLPRTFNLDAEKIEMSMMEIISPRRGADLGLRSNQSKTVCI